MPVEESGVDNVPAQWVPQTLYDFRGMPDGPRGYKVEVTKKGRLGSKRKLDEYSEQVEKDKHAAPMEVLEDEPKPVKRAKTSKQNTVGVGKLSGRSWKAPGQKSSSIRSGSSKALSASWKKKMREKAVAKELRERKKEALELKKAHLKEAREKREAAEKRKEENRKKAAVTQLVSSATARKMAKNKKLKKKLVTVDG